MMWSGVTSARWTFEPAIERQQYRNDVAADGAITRLPMSIAGKFDPMYCSSKTVALSSHSERDNI
jgi:hypothetical protein